MLNLRYIVRLIRAFFTRFKTLIFISFAFGIVIFFILKYLMPIMAQPPATKIGLTGRYAISEIPISILNRVSHGLTKLDANGYVSPDLASSWETPDMGKTWVFTLKDNFTWQDGKKVISPTISYQFSDVTIERPDDKTIIFKLQNPYSAFPLVVSKPVFKSGLMGTGEYRVTHISLNGSIVEELSLQNKIGEKVIYKFYPSEERTKLAFELGEVDKITDLFDLSPLNLWPKVKIGKSANTGEYAAVFFNTQDKSLKEKNLRQALSYAINKNALGGERAISPISIDSWAYNPQVKPYEYDPVKAKQIIADYKLSAKISNLSINLSSSPILLTQAEEIAKDWEAAGLTVNVQTVTQIPSDYQAFLAIFDIPDDPDQYSIWHSTQVATNITHYQNPRIDKLLEDGRSEINLENRKKIYLDFQRYLVEDSPATFLYYPTIYSLSRR